MYFESFAVDKKTVTPGKKIMGDDLDAMWNRLDGTYTVLQKTPSTNKPI